jgi:protease I
MKKIFLIIISCVIIIGCGKNSRLDPKAIAGKELGLLLNRPILPVADSTQIKRFVMVIAPRAFRDEEFKIPYEFLVSLGHKIKVASRDTILATGLLGMAVKPQLMIKDIDSLAFDGMILVGGTGAAIYWDDQNIHALAEYFERTPGKFVAAICLAPITLARAGILTDRRATVFKDRSTIAEFKEKGVLYLQDDVVISGNVITAASPQDAEKFARAIAMQILNLKSDN